MVNLLLLSLGALSGLFMRNYAACVPLGSAINSIFLHVNNVAIDCYEDYDRRLPYLEALLECAHDAHCCFVAVDELDAHTEGPGLSRLCSSCHLNNAREMKGARVSIKGEKIFGNIKKAFDITLNKQGICENEELLGEMSPVLSFTAAARECERRKCDYFTMSTLEGIDHIPGTVNKAWFCSGTPKNVQADGFITATRKYRHYEL